MLDGAAQVLCDLFAAAHILLLPDREKLLSPAEEGIRSVELANSILLSTWKDATISLPMDAAEYERILKDKSENSTFVKKQVKPKANADDFAKSFR